MVDVFGGFLFQHVHNVVVGDYTDEPPLGINHRNCREVVFCHDVRHFFLVGARRYINHIGIHDVFHHGIGRDGEQVAQVNHSDQAAFFVHHENVERNFGAVADLTQKFNRLRGGGLPTERDVGCGHQAAGAFIGVAEQRAHLVGVLHFGQCLARLLGR